MFVSIYQVYLIYYRDNVALATSYSAIFKAVVRNRCSALYSLVDALSLYLSDSLSLSICLTLTTLSLTLYLSLSPSFALSLTA